MARPMGARRAPSRRSYCGDKFALDWQHRHYFLTSCPAFQGAQT